MNPLIWLLVFIGLFLNLCWVSFYFIYDTPKSKGKKSVAVTIAVPAYNEEREIVRTLQSIMALDYPKDKLKVLVVNDGSTDRTSEMVRNFIAEGHSNVALLEKENGGKGSAINCAIDATTTPYFGCVDSDSEVKSDSLKNMLHHFDEDKVAAVITAIKPRNRGTLIEKLQWFEYLLSILFRTMRSNVDTLAITPGALTVYRTQVLKDVGGFDADDNLTEDFEIALNLKKHHYLIRIEPTSVTETQIPRTFKEHYQQQVRWFRGFIQNNLRYKDLFFKKGQGLFGWFDYPVGVLGIGTLFAGMVLLMWHTGKSTYEFFLRLTNIEGYVLRLFSWPRWEHIFLGGNEKFIIPAVLVLGLALYLLYVAHKHAQEKISTPGVMAAYIFGYPFLVLYYWTAAIYKEVKGSKREWHGIE